MRIREVVSALEPLTGMVLHDIQDPTREEAMRETMEVIRGWNLEGIARGNVTSPGHPQGVTNVHIQFTDGGAMPEFALSLRAFDVDSIDVHQVNGDGTARTRAEILFKRGHTVAIELV